MEFFSRLGLADPLAAALASFGFGTPTPVQTEAIPILLSRRDAIIESETGTGKTFAYLCPAFQLVSVLERKGVGEPGVIVAAPTQELAVQIGRESERLAKAAGLGLKTVVLLGGTSLEKQAAKLKAKPEIIVGTLGRLADLVALGKLRTTSLKLLVLDEADRLFANETENLARALLKSAPSSCTRVLVSATMPERIRREVRPLLRDAAEICPVGETVLSESIEHWCFYCDGRKRLDFTRRFEAAVHPARCLVFLTMATRVEKAALALAALGLPVGAIHSGMDKETRRVALERFAAGELRYLLTSDLGARGLDIAGITHVISLDLPDEPTVYTHRAGRTGRAGALGVSIVLADGIELARASKIAMKGGFVFRCKVLEERQVLEPTSEEFFARASAAEEQRMAAKASHVAGDAHRGLGFNRREKTASAPRAMRFSKPAPRTELGSSEHRGPQAPEIEGERTASKPRSAPWRESSEGAAAPHSRLYKKSEIIQPKDTERPRSAPHSAAPRGDRPTTERPYREGPHTAAPRTAPRNATSGDRPSTERPYAPRTAAPRTAPRTATRGDRPTAERPYRDGPRTAAPRTAPRAATSGDRPSIERPYRDGPRTAASRTAPRGDRPSAERPYREGPRTAAPRTAPRTATSGDRPSTERPHRDGPRTAASRTAPRGDRPSAERPYREGPRTAAPRTAPRTATSGDRPSTERPHRDVPRTAAPRTAPRTAPRNATSGDRPSTERPHREGPRTAAPRTAPRTATSGDRPSTERPYRDGPRTAAPRGDRPSTERPRSSGPGTASPRGGLTGQRAGKPSASGQSGKGPQSKKPHKA